MKTPARGARTHNLPIKYADLLPTAHIAAKITVLKDDNYETP